MDKIDLYINEVIVSANLFYKDRQRVSNELRDHLLEILSSENVNNYTLEETWKMIEKEFGNPQELGQEIATAKGRFLTYCKKSFLDWRSWSCVAIAILIFWNMASFFWIKTDKLNPIVAKDSLVLVWKWSSGILPGDIVVYKENDKYIYGLVEEVEKEELILSLGEESRHLPQKDVWGKVVLQTR